MMKTHPLFRVAAVLSSVLLVGGFVGYRAGAFSWLTETSAPSVDPASKPPDSTGQPNSQAPILYGTKSAVIVDPNLVNEKPATTQAPPVIMSGSKAMMPPQWTSPSAAKSPAPTQSTSPPTQQTAPTIMAGS